MEISFNKILEAYAATLAYVWSLARMGNMVIRRYRGRNIQLLDFPLAYSPLLTTR